VVSFPRASLGARLSATLPETRSCSILQGGLRAVGCGLCQLQTPLPFLGRCEGQLLPCLVMAVRGSISKEPFSGTAVGPQDPLKGKFHLDQSAQSSYWGDHASRSEGSRCSAPKLCGAGGPEKWMAHQTSVPLQMHCGLTCHSPTCCSRYPQP
jgi:hypothetical protein